MAEEEEEFTKQVLRLAITKISKQKGFQAIEKNALDTFVELMDYCNTILSLFLSILIFFFYNFLFIFYFS